MFIVEGIAGFLTNSLALLSDAGHMLTHLIALLISLGAILFAPKPPTARNSRVRRSSPAMCKDGTRKCRSRGPRGPVFASRTEHTQRQRRRRIALASIRSRRTGVHGPTRRTFHGGGAVRIPFGASISERTPNVKCYFLPPALGVRDSSSGPVAV